jgi:hypothetical protein
VVGVLIAAVCDSVSAQSEKSVEQTSVAAQYLFGRPHLAGITQPSVLRYSFARRSRLDEGFEDTIDVRIDAIRDAGRRDTSFAFFTGERQRPYPDLTDFFGNPLVLVFLQRDVWDLSRTRGGQARYFRYRIRQALREGAAVEQETIETAHGTIEARRITITPYENDRYRTRLDQFEFKTYEFVVSDSIPGEIYMIRTVVPAAASEGDGAEPLIEETIMFEQELAHRNGGAAQ